MTQESGRIVIIYLIYGDQYLDSGLTNLKLVAERMFPEREKVTLVVDNVIRQSESYSIDHQLTNRVIGGDNRTHEFSGWDHGYKVACEEYALRDEDIILFANDTFHRRVGLSYLNELTPELLRGHSMTGSTVGYCEDFPRDVRLMGIKYRSWIRSNIFFHPKPIADRLVPLAFPLPPDEIFSGTTEPFWSDTDQISDNWKAYISSWMFGTEDSNYPEYRLHWHAAAQPNAKNLSFFQTKARCILSEHYMAARLFDWGIPIIDFNMLERKPDRHVAPYYQQQPE